jgi:hypothetical protein
MDIYKVNHKTKEKVLVGDWDKETRIIEYLKPLRDISLLDTSKINTYEINYELKELEIYLTDIRDLLVGIEDKYNDRYEKYLSLGYFDKGQLVLWDQYLNLINNE